MPSRWLCLGIITFWLAANAWLAWRDVLPRFADEQPPSFSIDFLDELQMDPSSEVLWRVWLNGEETYQTSTTVNHRREDDTYELRATMRVNNIIMNKREPQGWPIRILLLKSMDRVTRDGGLRETHMTLQGKIAKGGVKLNAQLDGVVWDEQLWMTMSVSLPATRTEHEIRLEPEPVSRRGLVLMPLHPSLRIQGLRPGQTWRMPLVEPTDSLLGVGARVRELQGCVLPQPIMLHWRDRDVRCLVIEYTGEDRRARVLVEQDGGLVLRQEATIGDTTWEMERER